MERPHLEHLVDAAVALARAAGYEEPDRAQTYGFMSELLHRSQADGGRDLWGCYEEGLVTRTELRYAVMDRLLTHFAAFSVADLPLNVDWMSTELERSFDEALFP